MTPWDARYVHGYGIGTMKVHNATHLTYSQFTAKEFTKNGGWGAPPIDSFTIVRNVHNAPHPVCKNLGK